MKESLGHTFSGDDALWHACLQQSALHGGQMKYAFHFKADVGAVSHVVSGAVLKSGLLPPASRQFPASMWIPGSLAWGHPCVGSTSFSFTVWLAISALETGSFIHVFVHRFKKYGCAVFCQGSLEAMEMHSG